MQQKAGEEPGNEATLTPWTADHIAVALVAAPREVVVDWDDSWYAIVSCWFSTYRLDTETKGSTRFRNPRALGCSVPSAARALLRARGFLNRVDPIGLSV